jgi:hypothetical protein
VDGRILSPKWNSAVILDAAGPLPLSVDGGFVTHGGTVQLSFSGSTFTVSAGALASSVEVVLDGVVQPNQLNMFLNQPNTHTTFPTRVMMPALAAGSHTLTLQTSAAETTAGLRTDYNDIFQVVLTELPY